MSGLRALIKFAGHRTDGALATWQRLRAQCDEARHKLAVLKQHGQHYRELLHAGLRQGMPATLTMAYLGFIGQIEDVVVRQENDVGSLEEACVRQWQDLVDARREKRTYEILSERAATRELAASVRRRQTEIDDLLQRSVKAP